MKAKTLEELEDLKKPLLKEIAKIDAKINIAKKKLQSKCKHENARVKYHTRATLGSFWDGSETVFDIKCDECRLDQFVKAGSPLWQLCHIRANSR